jgi:hypothetical protein
MLVRLVLIPVVSCLAACSPPAAAEASDDVGVGLESPATYDLIRKGVPLRARESPNAEVQRAIQVACTKALNSLSFTNPIPEGVRAGGSIRVETSGVRARVSCDVLKDRHPVGRVTTTLQCALPDRNVCRGSTFVSRP